MYVKGKYEIFDETLINSNETLFFFLFGSPTFWILSELYELCESCHRNPLETFH